MRQFETKIDPKFGFFNNPTNSIRTRHNSSKRLADWMWMFLAVTHQPPSVGTANPASFLTLRLCGKPLKVFYMFKKIIITSSIWVLPLAWYINWVTVAFFTLLKEQHIIVSETSRFFHLRFIMERFLFINNFLFYS